MKNTQQKGASVPLIIISIVALIVLGIIAVRVSLNSAEMNKPARLSSKAPETIPTANANSTTTNADASINTSTDLDAPNHSSDDTAQTSPRATTTTAKQDKDTSKNNTNTNTTASPSSQQETIQGHFVITMQSPNGGEHWLKGTTYQIRWLKTADLNAAKMNLWLIDVTGSGVYEIAHEIPNTGLFAWNIPDEMPDGNYKIEVSQVRYTDGPVALDMSNNYFSITSPTAIQSVPAHDWTGNYNFLESAAQGQNEQYTLSVKHSGNNKSKYDMFLSIDGPDTQERFYGYGSEVNGRLEMIFTGHPKDHMGPTYTGGSLLFTLESTVSGNLKIQWNDLQPIFDSTDLENSYFIKI